MIRNYSNTVQPTSLSGPLSNAATTVNVVSTAGFPAVPFTVGVDRGTTDEEVWLVTNVTASTMTVTRGYNGTPAVSHLAGAAVEHCVCALDYHEANRHIEDDGRDDHPQYLTEARLSPLMPQRYVGTPNSIPTIDITHRTINTIVVPSSASNRYIQVVASAPITFASQSVTYVTRIWMNGVTRAATRSLVAPAGEFFSATTVAPWFHLPAGSSHTIIHQIQRLTGSGGEISSESNYNVMTALALVA